MTQTEIKEVKELKKANKSLEAKVERREKKIEDFIRHESYLMSVIKELEDKYIASESKSIVMNRKLTGIDREMLS